MSGKKKKEPSMLLGVAAFAAFVVIAYLIILITIEPESLGIGMVQSDGFKIYCPWGWEAETNTPNGFLVECVGPEKNGSRPNYNVMRIDYSGSFEDEIEKQMQYQIDAGVEKRSMVTSMTIDNKEVKTFHFRLYLEDKDYYAKGDQHYINEKEGSMIVVTCTTKESQYYNYNYELNKSVGLFQSTN